MSKFTKADQDALVELCKKPCAASSDGSVFSREFRLKMRRHPTPSHW